MLTTSKRIRPLNVEKQRSEATFLTNLVLYNKQAELIALSNAESLQRQELSHNFHTIKDNWHRLMNRQRWLDYWQNIYSRSLSVLPYFLLLPQFISGQIMVSGRTYEIAPGIYAGIEHFKLVYL